MDVKTMLTDALKRGQKALSEYDSKRLLAAYGIPVTREGLASDEDQAAALAAEIGWPVVLKGCGAELMHKSEGGWVELNLRDEQDVRAAYKRIAGSGARGLEGVLVQEMAPGQRELVLGLSRDPQFGPCVMLGLGGIFTELIKDTVFRMAPLDLVEARDMTEEFRSKAILGAFRGQKPADIQTLCRSLIAVGRIGLELDEVGEIDVNPMIVDPRGGLKAVDALVVLKRAEDA
ncbi:MAG: acetate--CoA ligase family protein [Proteobacteria bacterium]|nr:acetate--CoA ligase family protein [Pseudomonadota bacterium]